MVICVAVPVPVNTIDSKPGGVPPPEMTPSMSKLSVAAPNTTDCVDTENEVSP